MTDNKDDYHQPPKDWFLFILCLVTTLSISAFIYLSWKAPSKPPVEAFACEEGFKELNVNDLPPGTKLPFDTSALQSDQFDAILCVKDLGKAK